MWLGAARTLHSNQRAEQSLAAGLCDQAVCVVRAAQRGKAVSARAPLVVHHHRAPQHCCRVAHGLLHKLCQLCSGHAVRKPANVHNSLVAAACTSTSTSTTALTTTATATGAGAGADGACLMGPDVQVSR
jgi:hypothetical protein